jgi:hypothetical protein
MPISRFSQSQRLFDWFDRMQLTAMERRAMNTACNNPQCKEQTLLVLIYTILHRQMLLIISFECRYIYFIAAFHLLLLQL